MPSAWQNHHDTPRRGIPSDGRSCDGRGPLPTEHNHQVEVRLTAGGRSRRARTSLPESPAITTGRGRAGRGPRRGEVLERRS